MYVVYEAQETFNHDGFVVYSLTLNLTKEAPRGKKNPKEHLPVSLLRLFFLDIYCSIKHVLTLV